MSIELEILKRIMIMEAEGDEVDTTEGADEEEDDLGFKDYDDDYNEEDFTDFNEYEY